MSPSIRSRGYLPHWTADNPTFFVTFRLADSLPRELLAQLRRERQLLNNSQRAGTAVAADALRLREVKSLMQKAERYLDSGLGACHMRDFRIAGIVAAAIRHFDGSRYRLLAWCVMPNHVHVLVSPLGKWQIQSILHSWKSFSAQQANRLIGGCGPFWQHEYFDYLVRRESSLLKLRQYIINNPRRAGLYDWPWLGSGEPAGSMS